MKASRFLSYSFVSAFLLLVLFSLIGGVRSFWTDSEMWAVVAARNIFASNSLEWIGHSPKPLYNLLLYFNYFQMGPLVSHPIWSARIFHAANAVLVLALVYLILRRLRVAPAASFCAIALLAANSFFVKRFVQVRSDLLVSSLVLGLTWLQYGNFWIRCSKTRRWVVFALFAAPAILITPKAVFLFILWAYAFMREDGMSRRHLRPWPLALITLAVIAFAYWQRGALLFFLSSFSNPVDPYFSRIRFQPLIGFIQENVVIAILLGYTFYQACRRRVESRAQKMVDFGALTGLFLLGYPDRLAFFIASLAPFFVLSGFAPLGGGGARLLSKKLVQFSLIAYATANLVYWSLFTNYMHSSEAQEAAIGWLDKQFPDRDPWFIYDPVGILPYRDAANWFVGPFEAHNLSVWGEVKWQRPEIVLFADRLNNLGPEFVDFLDKNYQSNDAGIYIRRHYIPRKMIPVRCDWLIASIRAEWAKFSSLDERTFYVQVALPDRWLTPAPVTLGDLKSCETYPLPPTTVAVAILAWQPVMDELQPDLRLLFRFDGEF